MKTKIIRLNYKGLFTNFHIYNRYTKNNKIILIVGIFDILGNFIENAIYSYDQNLYISDYEFLVNNED